MYVRNIILPHVSRGNREIPDGSLITSENWRERNSPSSKQHGREATHEEEKQSCSLAREWQTISVKMASWKIRRAAACVRDTCHRRNTRWRINFLSYGREINNINYECVPITKQANWTSSPRSCLVRRKVLSGIRRNTCCDSSSMNLASRTPDEMERNRFSFRQKFDAKCNPENWRD